MKTAHTTALRTILYAGAFFLIVLSIIAISVGVSLSKKNTDYVTNTISVTGTAELSSVPDIARFSFNVQETAETTQQAQSVISKKTNTIFDRLEDLDIDDKDIKTDSYSMTPKYEWVKEVFDGERTAIDGTVYIPSNNQTRVQTGFDVSQRVTVTVRDFDNVGPVLDLLGTTGVQNLSGPNFEIDDPEKLQEELRADAIENAQEKAKQLAKDLDVKLGDLVSFNENKNNYTPQPYYTARTLEFAADVAYAPELPAGEEELSTSVTLTYEIK